MTLCRSSISAALQGNLGGPTLGANGLPTAGTVAPLPPAPWARHKSAPGARSSVIGTRPPLLTGGWETTSSTSGFSAPWLIVNASPQPRRSPNMVLDGWNGKALVPRSPKWLTGRSWRLGRNFASAQARARQPNDDTMRLARRRSEAARLPVLWSTSDAAGTVLRVCRAKAYRGHAVRRPVLRKTAPRPGRAKPVS